jgi:ribonuclease R
MAAERDTNDRYLAAYLSDRIGAEFAGRISGVQRFGLFVRLDETGADGLIPVRALGREFFHYDEGSQTLMGSETGLTLGIGQKVMVRLTEATPVTGGLILDLLSVEGATLQAPRRKGGKYQPRKPAQSAAKRRVVRKRK